MYLVLVLNSIFMYNSQVTLAVFGHCVFLTMKTPSLAPVKIRQSSCGLCVALEMDLDGNYSVYELQ